MDRFVCIGEVVKAIGLKGEVKLYPLLDFYEPLLDSEYLVWKDGSPASLKSHRQAGSCYALKCADVSDRNAAESMTGRELGFMSSSYLAEDFDRPDAGLPFRYLGREVHTVDGQVIAEEFDHLQGAFPGDMHYGALVSHEADCQIGASQECEGNALEVFACERTALQGQLPGFGGLRTKIIIFNPGQLWPEFVNIHQISSMCVAHPL